MSSLLIGVLLLLVLAIIAAISGCILLVYACNLLGWKR